MTDETVSGEEAARHAALNAALAGAFLAPATPPDLRAGVLAAIAREGAAAGRIRREDLQREHRAAIARLNRRYLRRCRDALLIGAVLLAAIGFSIAPLAHWLKPLFASAAPLLAGCVALLVGVACGAALLQDLFRRGGGDLDVRF